METNQVKQFRNFTKVFITAIVACTAQSVTLIGSDLPVLAQITPNTNVSPNIDLNVQPTPNTTIQLSSVDITSAKFVGATQCHPAGEANCVEVKWNVSNSRVRPISKIVVTLEVTQNNGQKVTNTKEVAVSTRDLLIATPRFTSDQDPVSFKVKVEALGKRSLTDSSLVVIASDTAQG
jgi:hypothetical protein